jgi:deazaflavin-dependent oxidoreductase (nitroreductase family)
MRLSKRRVTTVVGKYTFNPLVRAAVERGLLRGWAVLETIGRKSGRPRRTPVGNGLDGDTFWIVAEHGRRASYVRNIEANPRVRVNVRGRWRSGTAQVMPDDDPRARQRRMGRRLNAAAVRAMGTDLLTVRVDLAPEADERKVESRP